MHRTFLRLFAAHTKKPPRTRSGNRIRAATLPRAVCNMTGRPRDHPPVDGKPAIARMVGMRDDICQASFRNCSIMPVPRFVRQGGQGAPTGRKWAGRPLQNGQVLNGLYGGRRIGNPRRFGLAENDSSVPKGIPSPGRPPALQRSAARMAGWGGRIRTCAWRYQKPLPYHLATPQQARAPIAKPAPM